MACINLKQSDTLSVSIPYWFTTDYMPQASGGYVKVYLYVIAHYQQNNQTIDLEELSTSLNMLYSEVILALNYWDEKGVLHFNKLDKDTFELSFKWTKPQLQQELSQPKVTIHQTRPHYTADELALYKQQHDSIAKLFKICEEYLCRLLSSTDQQVLFGLYDWLNMPLDLIEYLVEYCASNNHTHIRYIEKVALNWIDQGITTVDAAKAQTALTKHYRLILKELGMHGETITKHQMQLFNTWLNDYGFDIEIVLEACRRTISHSSKPTLNYLGTILDRWHKNGVKSLEDIQKLDEAFQNNSQTTKQATSKPHPKNKTFTAIHSHNWDLDELEKQADDYMIQSLYGGN